MTLSTTLYLEIHNIIQIMVGGERAPGRRQKAKIRLGPSYPYRTECAPVAQLWAIK